MTTPSEQEARDDTWRAPWTSEQIAALERWQSELPVHEYTCGNDSQNHRSLVPTRYGWVCIDCDYRQDWAHAHTDLLASREVEADTRLAELDDAIASWESGERTHGAAVRIHNAVRSLEHAIREMVPQATCAECGGPISPFTYPGASSWMHNAPGGGMRVVAHEPRPAMQSAPIAAPAEGGES